MLPSTLPRISGVAKGPNVVAVKALDDGGNGQNFDVVYGPDFVAIAFQRTGIPTIVSLGLGGGVSNAIDSAIVRFVNFGVVFAAENGDVLGTRLKNYRRLSLKTK